MSSMRAMVLDQPGKQLALRERPLPQPGPGEILLEVKACGVCRTDLHVVDGELPNPQLPIVPGHEIVGRIVALGPGVSGQALGERVGVPWLGYTCGVCPHCRDQRENLCDAPLFTGYTRDGGFASHAVADARYYLLLLAVVLPSWLGSWPRLKANGFSKKVWLAGIWVLGGFSFIQVAKALSQPAIPAPLCPYDFVASGTVVALALYALYFYHLGKGNKGSFGKFFILVIVPIFGEVAVNLRDVEFGIIQILFRLWKVVVPLVHV
jgi:propanol-preferring alcohol dehydrogenase